MISNFKRLVSSITVGVLILTPMIILKADATSTSRQYAKYTYATKSVETYTLTISEPTSANSRGADYPEVPGVIGEDDRVPDVNNGIVKLNFSYYKPDANGNLQKKFGKATGFIVDDHTIATAAHCVYVNEPDNAQWDGDYSITLYDEEGDFDKKIYPVEAHIPYNFFTSSNPVYDYALLTVSEDLSQYTHFNLGSAYDIYDADFSEVNIYVSGFTGMIVDENGNAQSVSELYTGCGHIMQPSNADDSLLYYDTDVSYGTSGGPVYVKMNFSVGNDTYYSYTALSICNGIVNVTRPYFNLGPKFTSLYLQFYGNNPNIEY